MNPKSWAEPVSPWASEIKQRLCKQLFGKILCTVTVSLRGDSMGRIRILESQREVPDPRLPNECSIAPVVIGKSTTAHRSLSVRRLPHPRAVDIASEQNHCGDIHVVED